MITSIQSTTILTRCGYFFVRLLLLFFMTWTGRGDEKTAAATS